MGTRQRDSRFLPVTSTRARIPSIAIFHMLKGIGRPGDAVTERFCSEIVAGPNSGIASAGETDDLITSLGFKNGIKDRAMRQMTKPNVIGDGSGILPGGAGYSHRELA